MSKFATGEIKLFLPANQRFDKLHFAGAIASTVERRTETFKEE